MKLFDNHWQKKHYNQIVQAAHTRYSPKLHIDLPITKIFSSLTRDELFFAEFSKHRTSLRTYLFEFATKLDSPEIKNEYYNLLATTKKLDKLLSATQKNSEGLISWKRIKDLSERSLMLSDKLDRVLEQTDEALSDSQKKYRILRSQLEKVSQKLRFFNDFATSKQAILTNKRLLLITGVAGMGKTHLLCDLVEIRNSLKSQPATILLFGEHFTANQTIEHTFQNKLEGCKNVKLNKIIDALDKRGKKSQCHSLIIIDALNESRDSKIWKNHLPELIRLVKKTRHVALVISVRTGFESEYLGSKIQDRFIIEEHRGFQFRQWEAIEKFFNAYNVPLPEIPLLTPEFQSPLFLRLFCEAYNKKPNKKLKQLLRGQEGATHIFEHYIESIAKGIEDEFGIEHGPNRNIWDLIIDNVAALMVSLSTDALPKGEVIQIIRTQFPQINAAELLKRLEKNNLLVRVLIRAGSKNVICYRFPFQKFSDHLICRYIFKEFEKQFGKGQKTLENGRLFFSESGSIGSLLNKYSYVGLVEALCIEFPEHFKGEEFFEVAPYIKAPTIVHALIQSIVWRKSSAFKGKCESLLNFIDRHLIGDHYYLSPFLDALLTVSTIPNHPLSSEYFHDYFTNQTLARRDSILVPFFEQQFGQGGAVDRVITWSRFINGKHNIESSSLTAVCTILSWMTCTTNQSLRDQVIFCLAGLLEQKSSVLFELIKTFSDVNDPYVVESVFLVAYACFLRGKYSSQDMKTIIDWLYDKYFLDTKNIPLNALIRDYIRQIILLGIKNKVISIDLTPLKSRSENPTTITAPSLEELKQKYNPDLDYKKEPNYGSLWHSLMYNDNRLADFGNYTVGPVIDHWSNQRINDPKGSLSERFKDFKRELSVEQLSEYRDSTSLFKSRPIFSELKDSNDDLQPDFANFKALLSHEVRKLFEDEFEKNISSGGSLIDPNERFDPSLAQRWLFKRCIDLGWDPALHGDFDKKRAYSEYRDTNKSERIGKKYQWIALYELVGLLADGYKYRSEGSATENEYHGPWQLSSIRKIDPSFIPLFDLSRTSYVTPRFNNSQSIYSHWNPGIADGAWLRSVAKIPKAKSIIEQIDDKGSEWLTLCNDITWDERPQLTESVYSQPTRQLWYQIRSHLVNQSDADAFWKWLKTQDFRDGSIPENPSFYDVFLGEFPNSEAFDHVNTPYFMHPGWITDFGNRNKSPVKIHATTDQYIPPSKDGRGTDMQSSIKLPIKLLTEEMQLTQNHVDGRFYKDGTKLVCIDPHVFDSDIPSSLMIQKQDLVKHLNEKELVLFWSVLGEKLVIGDRFGEGRLEIRGSYRLNTDGQVSGHQTCKFKEYPKR